MNYFVQLFAAMALVILYCSTVSHAQLENGIQKMDIDNNIPANVVQPHKRRLRKYVRIDVPPPATVHLIPGSNLELQCVIVGSPPPIAHWLRNGEPIIDYEEEANEIPTQHPSGAARLTSKLITSNVMDGDIFTCVGTAGFNERTVSTTVFFEGEELPKLMTLEKLFNVPSKPVITIFYTALIQEIGTSATLPCRVQSYTKNQVFWQDSLGNMVYSNARTRVLPSGDLMINGLRWSDMGEWICTAQNDFGKDTIGTFVYPAKPMEQ